MKNIYRILAGLMAIAVFFASCKEPAPVETVSFAVYDTSGETPKTLNVNAKGKVGYALRVMSGAEWNLTVDGSDWITATPTSGPKGMRQVTVDVAANEELVPREGRLEFVCGTQSVSITVSQEKGSKADDDIIIPPVDSDAPAADLLDVIFKNDGTAFDNSVTQMDVQYISGAASVNYYHDVYERYAAHYSHQLGGEMAGGFYKIDYTENQTFRNGLADGHTLEVVFRMDQEPNGSEIKPFSSMQSGGTGFLITASNKGTDITFLPNVSTNGKSSWKWAQSGVVPEVGRYYHVVGVWDKNAGKAMVYVDGVKKGEVAATGDLVFPSSGSTWFCVGGDPSGNGAHAGFNGDVVLARVYDDPLTANDVTKLYNNVRNDVKSDVLTISNLAYLPAGSVAKGCWYYLYADGFKNGDVLILESTSAKDRVYVCETVYAAGVLKLQVPDNFIAGDYRIVLQRGNVKSPLGYTSLKLVNEIQQVNKTQIVAHRGYHPGSVPENSMASLVEAQKHAVYGSEFDVYVTTDDVVVLYHNASFSGSEVPENSKYKGWRPDSHTYDEIKDYKLANGEPLPTLDDYLNQALKCPEVKLILEIKTHNSTEKNMRAAKACYEAVKLKNMQNQVEYIAFNYDICKELVRLDPNAMVQYLNGDKDPADVLKDGIRGIDYSSSKLTDAWIKSANELGMTVNVWTVNSKAAMVDFMNKGVDLITTDEVEVGLSVTGKPFIANE